MTDNEMWANALLLLLWLGGIFWFTYKRKDDDKATANMRKLGRWMVLGTLMSAIIVGALTLLVVKT